MRDRLAQFDADTRFHGFVIVGARHIKRISIGGSSGCVLNCNAAINAILASVPCTRCHENHRIVGKVMFDAGNTKHIPQSGVGPGLSIVLIRLGHGGKRCGSDRDLGPKSVDLDFLITKIKRQPG